MADIYATSASSTTITLSKVQWSGSTPPTRSTDAAGRPTKSGATQSLWIGSCHLNGSNVVVDNSGERDIWNTYNQIIKPVSCSTNSNTGSTSWGTPGSSANGVGRISVCQGQANGTGINLVYSSPMSNGTSGDGGTISIGLDSTTSPTSTASAMTSGANNQLQSATVNYSANPGAGEHYFQCLFQAVTGGTITQSATYVPAMTGVWSY
jgi:hypothetical protein